MIEAFEEAGADYLGDGCGARWTVHTPIKWCDTREEARVEAEKGNTGEVVEHELLE